MNLDELNRAMVIASDSLQQTAKAAARAARALATATIEAISCAAAQEKEMELYRELQAGAETRDPFAELLQAMEQSLQAELAKLAEPAEDMPPLLPPKIPRPPKYLGPVNKANHTASRPPRRARSSCYKCHH